MVIDSKEYILFEELSLLEQDKIIFKRSWNNPLMTDKWREQVKKNYLIPNYGCDDPNVIFGKCDEWKPC